MPDGTRRNHARSPTAGCVLSVAILAVLLPLFVVVSASMPWSITRTYCHVFRPHAPSEHDEALKVHIFAVYDGGRTYARSLSSIEFVIERTSDSHPVRTIIDPGLLDCTDPALPDGGSIGSLSNTLIRDRFVLSGVPTDNSDLPLWCEDVERVVRDTCARGRDALVFSRLELEYDMSGHVFGGSIEDGRCVALLAIGAPTERLAATRWFGPSAAAAAVLAVILSLGLRRLIASLISSRVLARRDAEAAA